MYHTYEHMFYEQWTMNIYMWPFLADKWYRPCQNYHFIWFLYDLFAMSCHLNAVTLLLEWKKEREKIISFQERREELSSQWETSIEVFNTVLSPLSSLTEIQSAGLQVRNTRILSSSLPETRWENSPYCMLGLETEEETLSEWFNIINTVPMVSGRGGCQVAWKTN